EFFVEVLAEFVLATVAPGDGEIGGAIAAAAGHCGDELRVLVVGMRGNVQHGARVGERAQLLDDGVSAAGFLSARRKRGGEEPGNEKTRKNRRKEAPVSGRTRG